jgi:hypothetical protein
VAAFSFVSKFEAEPPRLGLIPCALDYWNCEAIQINGRHLQEGEAPASTKKAHPFAITQSESNLDKSDQEVVAKVVALGWVSGGKLARESESRLAS